VKYRPLSRRLFEPDKKLSGKSYVDHLTHATVGLHRLNSIDP
jgi:hypothetical protein